jgi:rhodanese-related sulfurtransferase
MAKSFGERVAEAKQAVSAVTPEQARALGATSGVVFVDPRPAEAIASTTGLIPWAWNVPLADIERGAFPAAIADKAAHVITSCQGGPMGAIAAHELAKQGFTRVSYIDGGTQGWLDAGFATHK